MSGHMFMGVSQEDHSVTIVCTRNDDPRQTATATVSGLQFIVVTPSLESDATTITVLWTVNIPANCMCKLDNEDFVPCKFLHLGYSLLFTKIIVVRCLRTSLSRCIRRHKSCYNTMYCCVWIPINGSGKWKYSC